MEIAKNILRIPEIDPRNSFKQLQPPGIQRIMGADLRKWGFYNAREKGR